MESISCIWEPQAMISGERSTQPLWTTGRKLIVEENTAAQYANGYIFFVKDGNLVAQPFDPDRLAFGGNPVPVAQKIEYQEAKSQGNYSVSQNGVLVYRSAYASPSRLIWLDQGGKQVATIGDGKLRFYSVFPDGRSIVTSREDAVETGKSDPWLIEVQREIFSWLTFHPATGYSAVWSPDGNHLAITSLGAKIQIIPASGSGTPVSASNEPVAVVRDWSPDGRTILVQLQTSRTGMEVTALFIGDKTQAMTPVLNSQFDEILPRLSPDGRWLAYISNDSGRAEVYVVPFPKPGGRWQISNNGAQLGIPGIVWSRDGKQLYFRDTAGGLMVVDVQPQGGGFHFGGPRQIFMSPGGVRPMDSAPDGRILVAIQAEQEVSSPVTLVLNWDAEMKK
jgi:Tol biopolymer transport system component